MNAAGWRYLSSSFESRTSIAVLRAASTSAGEGVRSRATWITTMRCGGRRRASSGSRRRRRRWRPGQVAVPRPARRAVLGERPLERAALRDALSRGGEGLLHEGVARVGVVGGGAAQAAAHEAVGRLDGLGVVLVGVGPGRVADVGRELGAGRRAPCAALSSRSACPLARLRGEPVVDVGDLVLHHRRVAVHAATSVEDSSSTSMMLWSWPSSLNSCASAL